MPSAVRCRVDHLGAEPPQSLDLTGFRRALVARDRAEVAGVLAGATDAARQGYWVAGFVSYEAAPAFDPAMVVSAAPAELDVPLAWFGLFDSAVELRPAGSSAGQPDGAAPAGPDGWRCEIDEAGHASAVGAIRRAVAEGSVYLVNYTARLRRPWSSGEDCAELYRRVCDAHTGGFHTFIETGDWAVACGSPELFLEMTDGLVVTRPMKGTARRGRWTAEDEQAAARLAGSEKERAENVMVVDLLRNDLGRVAAAGGVEVTDLWQVERYPTVWQLTSAVRARVRPGVDLPDVFAAMFPSGSVTGAPKIAAMTAVADLEPSRRGIYCGAVGLISPAGPGQRTLARFAVAIRTAVVDKRLGLVEYGSGGGITWDSDPAAEWQELCHKTVALDSAPARDFALIETMGYRPGSPCGPAELIHLDAHLERLAGSARYFGWPVPAGARQVLASAVADAPVPGRVRLELQPDGRMTVSVSPLGPDGAGGVVDLCVDDRPVRSSDVTLFHKTTRRERYDQAADRHPHAADVIMINERGQVTETTRANLLVRLGGRWFTPPLECGLLPGVGRAGVLAGGQVTERVITLDDLARAESLATVSSLRGRRPARLVAGCPSPSG